ncbi:unnamed protein product [Caenorhabditis bovis]|uniref:NADPH-dependent diflavin oxidoreductase 1 n=1 Tax=Caenorhabditis bovis TaxID=2654633 RepID=A0A8S1E5L7_9PELO|nr:unnamed protein product [Caenorhabditis bovis]
MSLLILYGSETGTAQDIAESLRREANFRKLEARVMELDEFHLENFGSEQVVLFVVSTTGQGEMPPNMRQFWKMLLKKSLPKTFLSNHHTAVLALGDSSYARFNFAGKKLYRRLLQLGATMLTPIGLADDQHEIGVDGAYIPWKTAVWNEIYKLSYFKEMLAEPDTTIEIEPNYRFVDIGICEDENGAQEYRHLSVNFNKRVTTDDHFQDTRLIRMNINAKVAEYFRYEAGDVLMVWPYNPEETVKIAIDALGYTNEVLDRKINIMQNSPFVKPFPYYIIKDEPTLRTCLHRYFDLQQVPKRSFFEIMASWSDHIDEKEKLIELSSPEGLNTLLDYSPRCRRTMAETLRDFPNTAKKIAPERLFELISMMRPRAFSIASAPNPEYIELLVAKVEYKSILSDKRRGLCSTYLSRLQLGDKVFCRVRKGTFKFPDADKPVICVGPGTGIAPFRSFLTQRNALTSERNSLLFFGCRKEKADYYFADEWPKLAHVEYYVAFSRDSEKKVYVQDKILEHRDRVAELLSEGAYIFIAGSSGDMPKAVMGALDKIVAKLVKTPHSCLAEAEASGRLQYETWS